MKRQLQASTINPAPAKTQKTGPPTTTVVMKHITKSAAPSTTKVAAPALRQVPPVVEDHPIFSLVKPDGWAEDENGNFVDRHGIVASSDSRLFPTLTDEDVENLVKRKFPIKEYILSFSKSGTATKYPGRTNIFIAEDPPRWIGHVEGNEDFVSWRAEPKKKTKDEIIVSTLQELIPTQKKLEEGQSQLMNLIVSLQESVTEIHYLLTKNLGNPIGSDDDPFEGREETEK